MSISLFVVANIFLSIYSYRYYQQKIRIAYHIDKFSKNRMKLMKMLIDNKITYNSRVFECLMTATSYSIRALYSHKDPLKALKEVDIIGKIMPFLEDEKTMEEFHSIDVEDKKVFVSTIVDVLMLYLESKYLQKLVSQTKYLTLKLQFFKFLTCIKDKKDLSYIRTCSNYKIESCAA